MDRVLRQTPVGIGFLRENKNTTNLSIPSNLPPKKKLDDRLHHFHLTQWRSGNLVTLLPVNGFVSSNQVYLRGHKCIQRIGKLWTQIYFWPQEFHFQKTKNIYTGFNSAGRYEDSLYTMWTIEKCLPCHFFFIVLIFYWWTFVQKWETWNCCAL